MSKQYAILALAFLAYSAASCAVAVTIFDDHFTGTDIGVPSGWSEQGSNGLTSIDDSAPTTVSLTSQNGRTRIFNDAPFNPQNGVTWTVELDNLFGNGFIESGFLSNEFGYRLNFGGAIQVNQGFFSVSLGSIPGGWSGEAIDITTTALQTGFQITTSTGFNSGFQPWSVFGSGMQLSDLGHTQALRIQVDAGAVTNTAVFDRVFVDASRIPEPSSSVLFVMSCIAVVGVCRGWHRQSAGSDEGTPTENYCQKRKIGSTVDKAHSIDVGVRSTGGEPVCLLSQATPTTMRF